MSRFLKTEAPENPNRRTGNRSGRSAGMKMPAGRAATETRDCRHAGVVASSPRCRTGCLRTPHQHQLWRPCAPNRGRTFVAHYRKTELFLIARPRRRSMSNLGNFLGLCIVPKWGTVRLEGIRQSRSKAGSRTCPLLPAQGPKSATSCRRFNHAIRHEWTLTNPITQVRCSAKRLGAGRIDPRRAGALFARLEQRDRAMVLLAGSTASGVPSWSSHLGRHQFGTAAKFTVRRSRVRQWFGEPKTEASEPVPALCFGGGGQLIRWRAVTPYSAETDFLFPSIQMNGTQLTPDMLLKRIIRPAAEAAGSESGSAGIPSGTLAGDKPSRPRRRCEGGAGTSGNTPIAGSRLISTLRLYQWKRCWRTVGATDLCWPKPPAPSQHLGSEGKPASC